MSIPDTLAPTAVISTMPVDSATGMELHRFFWKCAANSDYQDDLYEVVSAMKVLHGNGHLSKDQEKAFEQGNTAQIRNSVNPAMQKFLEGVRLDGKLMQKIYEFRAEWLGKLGSELSPCQKALVMHGDAFLITEALKRESDPSTNVRACITSCSS